jgi:hypothetical protein
MVQQRGEWGPLCIEKLEGSAWRLGDVARAVCRALTYRYRNPQNTHCKIYHFFEFFPVILIWPSRLLTLRAKDPSLS